MKNENDGRSWHTFHYFKLGIENNIILMGNMSILYL